MDFVSLTIIAAVIFLIAGTIKGLVGMGLPTASIALMTLFIDPRVAIALVMFPMIGSNAWQLWRGGKLMRTARRYWVFAIVVSIGVSITALGTKDVDERAILGVLGVALLLFVLASWRNLIPPLPESWDRFTQVAFGMCAGVIGGLTAGWAAPIAMYLASRQVDKDEFVRASGFLIFAGSLPLCFAYARLGFLTGPLAGISAAMLVPTLAGFTAGEMLRRRLPASGFRTVILWVFTALALNLLRRAIWGG